MAPRAQRAITAKVSRCFGSKGPSAAMASGRTPLGTAGSRQSQIAYATAVTARWAMALAAKTFASWPGRPASAMRELAMMPTALRGERLPALAPFATMSAPMNGEKRSCIETAAARGATRATLGTAPGPTAATAKATRNSSQGTIRPSPRASRTARSASRARVPLASLRAKSSVTPSRVRKSDAGKAAATASGLPPGTSRPSTKASPMAARPTFTRVPKLRAMARSRARSDARAALTAQRLT